MAEIRKHNPATDAISMALAKAMGEPVRPVVPGSKETKRPQSTAQSPIMAVPTVGNGIMFTRSVPESDPDAESDGGAKENDQARRRR